MKKVLSVLAIALLMAFLVGTTAMAHGGHGRNHKRARNAKKPAYAVCAVRGCGASGLHAHGGTYYYCRSHGKGLRCTRGHRR